MMRHDLDRTALLVIDVQRGLDDPRLGPRNNPACEANVAALIGAWRAAGRPVVFVRHDSVRPDSPLRPGQPAHGGGTISADELARVTATNLQDESADVMMTAELV